MILITADSTPKLHQLLKLVDRNGEEVRIRDHLAPKWEDLATYMHFERATSMIIGTDNVGKVEDACQRVLEKWLDGKGRKPVTWETLINVLVDVEKSELADKIKFVNGYTSIT